MEIVLASGSPRRRELLRRAGYAFCVCPSDADEHAEGSPMERAVCLARRKAESLPTDARPILAADTLVALDGRALGKPACPEEAAQMLRALGGRRHQVFTGVCLRAGRIYTACERTDVWFRPLSKEEISAYIASGEPMDKAGAYAIQGGAGAFVEKIEGPFDNVMGLPMELVKRLLAEAEKYGGAYADIWK